MKAEDLRAKTSDELKSHLLDLKKEQFNLRFQLSQGQLGNTARIRAVRRDIARINTFLNAGAGVAKPVPKAKRAAKPDKAADKAEKAENKARPAARKKSTGKTSAA